MERYFSYACSPIYIQKVIKGNKSPQSYILRHIRLHLLTWCYIVLSCMCRLIDFKIYLFVFLLFCGQEDQHKTILKILKEIIVKCQCFLKVPNIGYIIEPASWFSAGEKKLYMVIMEIFFLDYHPLLDKLHKNFYTSLLLSSGYLHYQDH